MKIAPIHAELLEEVLAMRWSRPPLPGARCQLVASVPTIMAGQRHQPPFVYASTNRFPEPALFKSLQLTKSDTGFAAAIVDTDEAQLPAGDVLAQVEYSTLNYKDGLAITNKAPVVRAWPMVAGIDGAGTVIESTHAGWKAGDKFVHNGWGLGETRWGLMAERARLQGDRKSVV